MIYQLKDKVFDVRYGWGEVVEITDYYPYPITVTFEKNKVSYTKDGNNSPFRSIPSLSFTEYDLVKGGFSQKRPIEIPKKGQIVYVREASFATWHMRYFSHYDKESFYCFLNQQKEGSTSAWSYCSIKNPLEQ